jgi:hypothetical protein
MTLTDVPAPAVSTATTLGWDPRFRSRAPGIAVALTGRLRVVVTETAAGWPDSRDILLHGVDGTTAAAVQSLSSLPGCASVAVVDLRPDASVTVRHPERAARDPGPGRPPGPAGRPRRDGARRRPPAALFRHAAGGAARCPGLLA